MLQRLGGLRRVIRREIAEGDDADETSLAVDHGDAAYLHAAHQARHIAGLVIRAASRTLRRGRMLCTSRVITPETFMGPSPLAWGPAK